MTAVANACLKQCIKKKWRGIFLDFVNLITTMPSRHSGDQAHKVDFSPHCTIAVPHTCDRKHEQMAANSVVMVAARSFSRVPVTNDY